MCPIQTTHEHLLIAFGGMCCFKSQVAQFSKSMAVYSEKYQTWTDATNDETFMPLRERISSACVTIGQTIYVVGGQKAISGKKSFEVEVLRFRFNDDLCLRIEDNETCSGVTGSLFSDRNNDAVFDGTKESLVGITVSLYKDEDGDGVISEDSLASLTPAYTTVTGKLGVFTFPTVSVGSYAVVAQPGPNDGVMFKESISRVFSLRDEPTVTVAAMGATGTLCKTNLDKCAIVSGHVFLDHNEDGKISSTEPGIEGVVVRAAFMVDGQARSEKT
eukprot:897526_1